MSLSGVGVAKNYRDTERVVPRKPKQTRLDLEPGDDVGMSVDDLAEDSFVAGFVFHESCWTLLNAVNEDEEVPLERLLSVLQSLSHPRDIGSPDGGMPSAGSTALTIVRTTHRSAFIVSPSPLTNA